VLNSYRDRCLYIINLFDTFSIKHIPQEENSWANRLAQQASGYVVSQGVFGVASVSLVEHRYALRSKGKSMLENSDRLQDEEKPIPDSMNRLPGKTGPESGKTESGSGKAEPESRKIEPNRVVKSGYRKKQNRLQLKVSRKSRLQRRTKWRRMGHL
jgi:hypothetical protein